MFKTVFFKSIDNYGSRITRSSRWKTQGINKNLELNKIPAEMHIHKCEMSKTHNFNPDQVQGSRIKMRKTQDNLVFC